MGNMYTIEIKNGKNSQVTFFSSISIYTYSAEFSLRQLAKVNTNLESEEDNASEKCYGVLQISQFLLAPVRRVHGLVGRQVLPQTRLQPIQHRGKPLFLGTTNWWNGRWITIKTRLI